MVEDILRNLKEVKNDFEIIEDDFKMIYDGHRSFDLFFKNKKDEWKFDGYNIPLENCMKRIMLHRINTKYEVMSFKTFFQEMKKMNDEVTQLLVKVTGNG
jgi:hypothetical protein